MRILFVHDNPTHQGGAETYMFSLMELLKERGHQTFLFSFKEDEDLKTEETEDSFIYGEKRRGWLSRHISYYYFDLGVYRALKSYIREVKPDVIHLQNITKHPTTIILAAGSSGVPVVQTIHDIRAVCLTGLCMTPDGGVCDGGFSLKCARSGCIRHRSYVYNILPNMMRRCLMKRRIKTIICASRAFEKKMRDSGINNVTYLPLCIESSKYDPDPARIEDGSILFAGMLEKSKGTSYLIGAFPRIAERFENARLHILGDGSEREALVRRVDELKIRERVIFHGKVMPHEMPQYYSKANVVVFPSICFENSPYVIREAMAAGRPVVGSDTGGVSEMVEESKTGFIVPIGNSEKIAERVNRLLSDKDYVIQLGKAARSKVEREFGVGYHMDRILELYRSVIQ